MTTISKSVHVELPMIIAWYC